MLWAGAKRYYRGLMSALLLGEGALVVGAETLDETGLFIVTAKVGVLT